MAYLNLFLFSFGTPSFCIYLNAWEFLICELRLYYSFLLPCPKLSYFSWGPVTPFCFWFSLRLSSLLFSSCCELLLWLPLLQSPCQICHGLVCKSAFISSALLLHHKFGLRQAHLPRWLAELNSLASLHLGSLSFPSQFRLTAIHLGLEPCLFAITLLRASLHHYFYLLWFHRSWITQHF